MAEYKEYLPFYLCLTVVAVYLNYFRIHLYRYLRVEIFQYN